MSNTTKQSLYGSGAARKLQEEDDEGYEEGMTGMGSLPTAPPPTPLNTPPPATAGVTPSTNGQNATSTPQASGPPAGARDMPGSAARDAAHALPTVGTNPANAGDGSVTGGAGQPLAPQGVLPGLGNPPVAAGSGTSKHTVSIGISPAWAVHPSTGQDPGTAATAPYVNTSDGPPPKTMPARSPPQTK